MTRIWVLDTCAVLEVRRCVVPADPRQNYAKRRDAYAALAKLAAAGRLVFPKETLMELQDGHTAVDDKQRDDPLTFTEDRGWVHGRMVYELGLRPGQYRTREDDGLGELQLQAIADAVEQCRFTVLVASSAARWDKLAQFAAGLAQHAGLEDQAPRLLILARDFAPASDAERTRLSLAQRALVGLDCSDEAQTVASLARLRTLLA